MRNLNRLFPVASVMSLAFALQPAAAINITASTDANALIDALIGGGGTGIIVTSATLNGHTEVFDLTPYGGSGTVTLTSSGTYTNASGTYDIGAGVVLTTGAVTGFQSPDEQLQPSVAGYGDGPNQFEGNSWAYQFSGVAATPAQETLLDPITGNPDCTPPGDCSHFDVTELVINFDMQPGFSQVRFNIVFGSEEWFEYADSAFIDGFGMYLNGVNIASVGGEPVNIQHPDTRPNYLGVDELGTPLFGPDVPGTELDGILAPGGNPLLTFSGAVNATGNQLRFILADTSDPILDTTVYFSALTAVPAPPVAWLLGSALAGLLGRGWQRRLRARAARSS